MAFFWGQNGQQISTPEQAKRARTVAESLINQPKATNWGEGLARVTGAYAANQINDRVGQAETEGAQSAAASLAQLGSGASQEQIIAALSNPWLSGPQSQVASALLNSSIQQQDPLYQAQLAQALAGPEANPETYFGTGIPIDNGDGTISYGQFGNQGGFNIPELPDGASFLTPVSQLNTGTEFVDVDKFGNRTGGATSIDNFTPAQDAELGKVIGGAAAQVILELPSTIATTDNMVNSIDGILNDPALDASTGWLSWMQSVPGTDQYRFGQRALQLQGQAFLQAFDSLKGAGQITEVEGAKATQAIGRLSTSQNPADYRQALSELKGIISAAKQRAINSAGQVQLPGNSAIQPQQASPSGNVRVFNPATGRLE